MQSIFNDNHRIIIKINRNLVGGAVEVTISVVVSAVALLLRLAARVRLWCVAAALVMSVHHNCPTRVEVHRFRLGLSMVSAVRGTVRRTGKVFLVFQLFYDIKGHLCGDAGACIRHDSTDFNVDQKS